MATEIYYDYVSQVRAAYLEKKAATDLSGRLIQLTSANLRDECEAVCEERYHRKDAGTLNMFFERCDDKEAYLLAIHNCDPDKFKPLIKFLKGKTRKTGYKNIELLAWLIDFQPRPYQVWKKNGGKPNVLANPVDEREEEKAAEELKEQEAAIEEAPAAGAATGEVLPEPSIPAAEREEITEAIPAGIVASEPLPEPPVLQEEATGVTELEATPAPETASRFKKRRAIVAVLLIILMSIAAVGYWQQRNNKGLPVTASGPQGCMYWAGDHYEQVPCTQKPGDTPVVVLDMEKLRNFKKIMQPDTITSKSKGFVWYVKINGHIEFYTSPGFHPVDQRLRLKPITDYMIRKYINPGQAAEQAAR
jgi:hypothetical protein